MRSKVLPVGDLLFRVEVFMERFMLNIFQANKTFLDFWDEKTGTCKVCNKKMVKTSVGKHYQNVHLKINVNVCDICGDKFSTKQILKTHKLYKHTDPSKLKKFECKLCSKQFLLKGKIGWFEKLPGYLHIFDSGERWAHLRKVHAQIIVEKCTLCGYQDVPSKARHHKCKVCGKCFLFI